MPEVRNETPFGPDDLLTDTMTLQAITPEITFDEHFFPARPHVLRRVSRRQEVVGPAEASGLPDAGNPAYLAWLRAQSMLEEARLLARTLSGQGAMWQNRYGTPSARSAVATASVWFTAYPLSMITAPGQSFLATMASDELWRCFRDIGIEGVHLGPVKAAGGLDGWRATPTVDGHFDRVSNRIDPVFGSEQEFRDLCARATEHAGIVIDDVIPGHTGKGADFRLAEMAVDDYPGIYHMVEIPLEHWWMLPDVPVGHDSVNIHPDVEAELERAGHIIGRMQRVIFLEPGVKETNWSVTAPVTGVDGVARRWVYLHYFKAGQPSINWLDPSFAGMRLVVGDALHSLVELGTGGLRLDANGFLGVEKTTAGMPAWSEGHPLSEAANHMISSMVRKVGGFTFQELNLSIDDIAESSIVGADLSYDFVNRPAYQHAFATGDTEFLRLTLRESAKYGVAPGSLVHGLQNHDELTYELIHFTHVHAQEQFAFRGGEVTGVELADVVRRELREAIVGDGQGANRVFTTNGIACTTVSMIAAVLGFDLTSLDHAQREQIMRAHVLLAMFNAWQPGVFALSGWDLAGMLPIPVDRIAGLLVDGDTRWLHRPAHDLLNVDPSAQASRAGLPRTESLYGPVTEQLKTRDSFAGRLRRVLKLRHRCGLSVATQIDVPEVSHPGLVVMVHRLANTDLQVTVLNFSREAVAGSVFSEVLPPRRRIIDMQTGIDIGVVDDLHRFGISLGSHRGTSLLLPRDPK